MTMMRDTMMRMKNRRESRFLMKEQRVLGSDGHC